MDRIRTEWHQSERQIAEAVSAVLQQEVVTVERFSGLSAIVVTEDGQRRRVTDGCRYPSPELGGGWI